MQAQFNYHRQGKQNVMTDSAGVEINFAGTGQDGEIRAGVPWSEGEYTRGKIKEIRQKYGIRIRKGICIQSVGKF